MRVEIREETRRGSGSVQKVESRLETQTVKDTVTDREGEGGSGA